jgi:competence protein ComGF
VVVGLSCHISMLREMETSEFLFFIEDRRLVVRRVLVTEVETEKVPRRVRGLYRTLLSMWLLSATLTAFFMFSNLTTYMKLVG